MSEKVCQDLKIAIAQWIVISGDSPGLQTVIYIKSSSINIQTVLDMYNPPV